MVWIIRTVNYRAIWWHWHTIWAGPTRNGGWCEWPPATGSWNLIHLITIAPCKKLILDNSLFSSSSCNWLVLKRLPVNAESQLVWPGLVYALNLQSSLRHCPLLKVVHFELTVSFSIQHPLSWPVTSSHPFVFHLIVFPAFSFCHLQTLLWQTFFSLSPAIIFDNSSTIRLSALRLLLLSENWTEVFPL